MKKGILGISAKEEIQGYVELLREAFADKSKIYEVLSYENTSLLKSYLLSLGISPELLEYAAVVEYVREDIRNVLTKAQKCDITEKGIEAICYDCIREEYKIKARDDGGILLSWDDVIGIPKENGKVSINGKFYSFIINRFGAVEYKWMPNASFGEYYTESRKEKDGKPIVVIEESDGATYGYKREVEDFGDPLNQSDQKRSFKDNYELFTNLYPRLQTWYAYRFPVNNRSIEEYSDMLSERQLDAEIKKLEDEIRDLENSCRINAADIKKKEATIANMTGFIQNIKHRSPVGKRAAERILKKIEETRKTEMYEEETAKKETIVEEAVPENETREEKKARLERKLKNLNQKATRLLGENANLNATIKTIKKELEGIPLIGRTLGNVVTRRAVERTNKDGQFEDDEYPLQ